MKLHGVPIPTAVKDSRKLIWVTGHSYLLCSWGAVEREVCENLMFPAEVVSICGSGKLGTC